MTECVSLNGQYLKAMTHGVMGVCKGSMMNDHYPVTPAPHKSNRTEPHPNHEAAIRKILELLDIFYSPEDSKQFSWMALCGGLLIVNGLISRLKGKAFKERQKALPPRAESGKSLVVYLHERASNLLEDPQVRQLSWRVRVGLIFLKWGCARSRGSSQKISG